MEHRILLQHQSTYHIGILSIRRKQYTLLHTAFQRKEQLVLHAHRSALSRFRKGTLKAHHNTVLAAHLKVFSLALIERLSVHIGAERAECLFAQMHLTDAQTAVAIVIDRKHLCCAGYGGNERIPRQGVCTHLQHGMRAGGPLVIIIARERHKRQRARQRDTNGQMLPLHYFTGMFSIIASR